MPVGIADVIFTQCVLDQINFVLDLQGVHLRDDNNFAQLAEQVLVVG